MRLRLRGCYTTYSQEISRANKEGSSDAKALKRNNIYVLTDLYFLMTCTPLGDRAMTLEAAIRLASRMRKEV